MLPIYEKINLREHESIHVHEAQHPHLETPLHYHPEIEIIYVAKSFGTRIVGHSIESFLEGDMVMVGPNVPHVWRNDKVFYAGNTDLEAVVRVIHFTENCLGDAFIGLPEMDKLRKLFTFARRAICFTPEQTMAIKPLFDAVFEHEGQGRIVAFIGLLHYLSDLKPLHFLMETEPQPTVNTSNCDKISIVYEYLLNNYADEIDFAQLAALTHMSQPSLCRVFKQRTQRNITDALNQIRISMACKLLRHPACSATEACYKVGYRNYSHFNKQFKLITGITPLRFRKMNVD